MNSDVDVVPFLLSLAFRPALLAIMAQLDPMSFFNFSVTCSALNTFALSKNSGIKVPFYLTIVSDYHGIRMKWLKEGEGRRTMTQTMLRKAKKYPFKFIVRVSFKQAELHLDTLTATIQFISRVSLPIRTVATTDSWRWTATIHCWPEMINFLQNHDVGDFVTVAVAPPEIFNVLYRIPFNTLIVSASIPRDVEFLRNVKPKVLQIYGSGLTKEFFQVFVQEIARGTLDHIDSWYFYDQVWPLTQNFEEFLDCFKNFENVDQNGPLPTHRPLVCGDSLLNVNNKVFTFEAHEDAVNISSLSEEYLGPPVFLPFL